MSNNSKLAQAIELLDQADILIQSAIPNDAEGIDSYGIYCELQELIDILRQYMDEQQGQPG